MPQSSRKTSIVFMFDKYIARDIHNVTTADNEPIALHTTTRAAPKYLLIATQTIVCNEVVMGEADMNQVKHNFSDLIISSVAISNAQCNRAYVQWFEDIKKF